MKKLLSTIKEELDHYSKSVDEMHAETESCITAGKLQCLKTEINDLRDTVCAEITARGE